MKMIKKLYYQKNYLKKKNKKVKRFKKWPK